MINHLTSLMVSAKYHYVFRLYPPCPFPVPPCLPHHLPAHAVGGPIGVCGGHGEAMQILVRLIYCSTVGLKDKGGSQSD